jgi:hypothetical protein
MNHLNMFSSLFLHDNQIKHVRKLKIQRETNIIQQSRNYSRKVFSVDGNFLRLFKPNQEQLRKMQL